MTKYFHQQTILSAALLCISFPGYGDVHPRQPASSFDALAREAARAKETNQLARAASLYGDALKLKPEWEEGWWSLGTIEYDQGEFKEAQRSFKNVVSSDPKQNTARLMLGLCEFELGEDGSALEDIEQAKAGLIPVDPQLRDVLLYHDGVLLRRAAKFEGADEVLKQLCRHSEGSDAVTQELGMVMLRMTQKLLPPEDVKTAAIVNQLGQAECLVAGERFNEAMALGAAAVKEHPDFPNVHYAYGRLLLSNRDTAAAITEFEREIVVNPADAFSHLEIAAVKYRIDSAAGIPYAEQAVKLNPRLPLGHFLLGLLLLDIKEYQKAIPELEIAKQSFPNEPKVYFALGTAYARVGRQLDSTQARARFLTLDGKHGSEEGKLAGEEIDVTLHHPSAEGRQEQKRPR